MCGTCENSVTFDNRAVVCDTCDQWYRIGCQDIHSGTYSLLIEEGEDVRWDCIVYGNANYSEVCYGSTSFETTNRFSWLTDLDGTNDSIQKPPKPIHASTPEKNPRTNKKKIVSLRVINVNCQSIRNKQHQIENMIDSLKPDVIIATDHSTDHYRLLL